MKKGKSKLFSPARHTSLFGRKLRGCLYELLIFGGAFLLAGAGLVFTRGVLAAEQIAERVYLVSQADLVLALPSQVDPASKTPVDSAPVAEDPGMAEPPAADSPGEGIQTGENPAVAPLYQPAPTPFENQPPAAGRIVHLVIPTLKIDRAVMPIAPRVEADGRLSWNTDILFSTANRTDLVGQPLTSVNPGDGGNIILLGHNYNNGWGPWEGVFINLSSLKPGDLIQVKTEHGGVFQYAVERVKKVPWQKQNSAELEKHQKFILPTAREQLTLVTCGGANLWTWSARIYVVAIPY